MEAEELSAPPPLLERAVQCAIPPSARETVVGDLREIYSTPGHYLLEALRTVPLVAASCALRAINPPLLVLQGALILWGLAGLKADSYWLGGTNILALTGLLLAGIVVRDTYRKRGRPHANRAIIEAIAIALLLIVVSPQGFGLALSPRLAFYLLSALPLAIPFFGLLRTLLIVDSDRQLVRDDDIALAETHRLFVRQKRKRYRIEAGLFAACAAVGLAAPGFRFWLPLLYVPASAALVLAANAHLDGAGDAQALRALYRRQLAQDRQLRRILWWLWAAPVLVFAARALIHGGLAGHDPSWVILGNAALILVCYLVGAVNDEGAGRTEEKIGRLERLSPSAIERA